MSDWGRANKRRCASLRHTFASYFIQSGGNILTLQKMGHSSLAMTMRYAEKLASKAVTLTQDSKASRY